MGDRERSPGHGAATTGRRPPDLTPADDTRRELFLRLLGAYPALPLPFVLSAIEEYERGIALCGDGPAERAVMELVTRHNLKAASDALAAAAERRKGPGEGPGRVGPRA